MVPLRWTSKSTRNLANDLKTKGYNVGYVTVSTLLHELDYSLQVNKKSLEKSSHADRDAQFRYINDSVIAMHKKDEPTIFVDTKKKEIIGAYKNHGQDLCRKGQPTKVNTHDFPDPRLGKVVPYGVYDIGKKQGVRYLLELAQIQQSLPLILSGRGGTSKERLTIRQVQNYLSQLIVEEVMVIE